MKKKPVVSVIMGSDSDLTTMMNAADTLRKFGIAYELKISSAHRTPEHRVSAAIRPARSLRWPVLMR